MAQLKAVQAQEFQLAGSGVTSTATTIILTNFLLPDGVTEITMADIGLIGFMTLEPGTSREEQITFTTVTQNADDTATLTGVVRGVAFVSPYSTTAALKKSHAGGTIAVLSNTAGFYGNIKDYIDEVAIAGAPDASLTAKGLVETAITSEIDAGTVSGATGADLSVRPDQLAASIYGTRLPSAAEKSYLSGVLGLTGVIVPYGGRSAPSGWLMADGSAVSRATYASLFAIVCPSGTVTVTLASPAVFTKIAHGYVAGDKVHFTTSGALPTGISSNTDYYVMSTGLTADAFQIALSPAGSAINSSGSQSGVHTVYASAYGRGDGSTTFNLPNPGGKVPVGRSATAQTQTLDFAGAQRSSNDITILNTVFPSQGQAVILTTTGALPTGLSLATTYYIIRNSSTSIAFATSQANANAGTKITLSGDGSGVNTMTFTNRAHTVLGRTGGEETHGMSIDEMPSHNHNFYNAVNSGGQTSLGSASNTEGSQNSGIITNTGGSGLQNNMSPFLVLNYIIKT